MRIAYEDTPKAQRNWPDPTDIEFVKAGAALLGVKLEKAPQDTCWRMTEPRHWHLYGVSRGEIQGAWIPETDEEWLVLLARIIRITKRYELTGRVASWLDNYEDGLDP